MQIYDYIATLKWHPTRVWNQRQLSEIKKIIVHQSLSKATDNFDDSLKAVNNYHAVSGSTTGVDH